MYWKAETESKRVFRIGGREEFKERQGTEYKKDGERQSRENEGMKGQQRDNAFNHLSFLPWLSAPLLFDM